MSEGEDREKIVTLIPTHLARPTGGRVIDQVLRENAAALIM